MTLVVVRRDLQVFILAVGHLCDLIVNKALKTWFAQARPPGVVVPLTAPLAMVSGCCLRKSGRLRVVEALTMPERAAG